MAATKQEPKERKVYLEYLVRECKELRRPHTRLVAMVLASSADWHTFSCQISWDCLLHWTKVSRGSLHSSIKDMRESGILDVQTNYKSASIFTFNVERLKELAEPWSQTEKAQAKRRQPTSEELERDKAGEPEQTHDSIYADFADHFNHKMRLAFGEEGRASMAEVKALVEEQDEDPAFVLKVLGWFTDEFAAGRYKEIQISNRTNWPAVVKHYENIRVRYGLARKDEEPAAIGLSIEIVED